MRLYELAAANVVTARLHAAEVDAEGTHASG